MFSRNEGVLRMFYLQGFIIGEEKEERRMKGGREEVALSLGHGSVFWLIHAYEMRTKPE